MYDIHHKRYNRFNENYTDLRRLCRPCHTAVHKMGLEEHLSNSKTKRRDLRDMIYG